MTTATTLPYTYQGYHGTLFATASRKNYVKVVCRVSVPPGTDGPDAPVAAEIGWRDGPGSIMVLVWEESQAEWGQRVMRHHEWLTREKEEEAARLRRESERWTQAAKIMDDTRSALLPIAQKIALSCGEGDPVIWFAPGEVRPRLGLGHAYYCPELARAAWEQAVDSYFAVA